MRRAVITKEMHRESPLNQSYHGQVGDSHHSHQELSPHEESTQCDSSSGDLVEGIAALCAEPRADRAAEQAEEGGRVSARVQARAGPLAHAWRAEGPP
mmetsp:Transcript_101682/g.323069  ORF Transcript_101682/g.323069 Transcript_101682/m.323069 type:complete len:98 (+) Transcript_101682:1776-2069(+)